MNNKDQSSPASNFEISHHFNATAEQVFDAWLDPEGVGRWFFKSPEGVMKRVELDPKVGGDFVISEQRGDELAEHLGTFQQIDRPSVLVFAYSMDMQAPRTVVTINITAEADGCSLTLTHKLEPEWTDILQQINQGWTMILNGLEAELAA